MHFVVFAVKNKCHNTGSTYLNQFVMNYGKTFVNAIFNSLDHTHTKESVFGTNRFISIHVYSLYMDLS